MGFSSASLETIEVPFTYAVNDVVDGLNAASYQDGFTHTGAAMAWTWNNPLNAGSSLRTTPTADKVLIVMTDGKAMDPDVVQTAGDAIKANARVYAIGIGKDVSFNNLRAIA